MLNLCDVLTQTTRLTQAKQNLPLKSIDVLQPFSTPKIFIEKFICKKIH